MADEPVETARALRESLRPEDLYAFRRLRICPDFCDVWAEIDDNDTGNISLPIGEGLEWAGERPIPYDLIVRFDIWQKKFDWAAFDDEMYLILDWDAFHKEGLALSIEIKRALGDDIVVTYLKAFEDRHQQPPKSYEIQSDG